MKQYSYLTILGGLLAIMLIFPQETLAGASNGLLLWFQIVLPTLLPFIILSNLLIQTNSVYYISKLLSPILRRFFHVSDSACYAILIGFMCGYPMGAKVIADLIDTKRISETEGQYLLSFCNNTSPMFIISYVITQNLNNPDLIIPSLLILFGSPVLCSFLFRRFYFYSNQSGSVNTLSDKQIYFNFSILDHSIMNGFETITKIGGYIILFSILFTFGKQLPGAWIMPILEITNGIPYILDLELPFHVGYISVLALTSFGGFCATAQTYSMIQNTKLSILPYIIQKLITATVTSLLAFLYILFILQ
ncbi:MAG: transporter [Tyzzerella sp.]|nr:transporter [Tyzzerella sp.]